MPQIEIELLHVDHRIGRLTHAQYSTTLLNVLCKLHGSKYIQKSHIRRGHDVCILAFRPHLPQQTLIFFLFFM